MADNHNNMPEEATGVDISESGGISIFWVIPAVALLIGLWLVVTAYLEEGPLVTIEFKNAAGVIADKTRVRMRDVDIGVVEEVVLSDDLQRVIVKARLTRQSSKMLVEGTRFWVETPRVTATEIKGLQTLLSGVFIGIDPAQEGEEKSQFIGLDEAPFIAENDKGKYFTLRAESRGTVNQGSPVIYRGIDVGQVVSYQMNSEGSRVDIKIYIEAPYFKHINLNSRFWEISGIDIKLSSEGIEVNTGSMVSVLIGGITFGTPDYTSKGEMAPGGHEFRMFKDQQLAYEQHRDSYRALFYFNGSVRGLEIGAPVEFRGIRIGEVLSTRLQISAADFSVKIPVLVVMEKGHFEIVGEMDAAAAKSHAGTGQGNLQKLVDKGLRAQLKTGSLLTGALYVDLDLHIDAPPAQVTMKDGAVVLPTVPSALDAITAGITTILNKIAAMPLEQIGRDLGGTIKKVRELVESDEIEGAVSSLNSALKETEAFTKSINTTITPQLDATLRELKDASRSIKAMADYLERHPEALIKGKQGGR